MSPTIAIIGTAGRKDDADRLSAALYEAMYLQAVKAIQTWGTRRGVSGGAAYADHLAVRAYLEGHLDTLTLYLPAQWNAKGRCYVPNPAVQFNPGKTANWYHRCFSERVGIDSFAQIAAAEAKGARLVVHEGFHDRNRLVARDASHLLALTFGPVRTPSDIQPGNYSFTNAAAAGLKDGGTAHTWGVATDCVAKRHVSLGWLAMQPAQAA